MSLVSQKEQAPQKVSINGQPPKMVKLIFQTYKIATDEDTKELLEIFAEGVEIIMQIECKDFSYVIVKKPVDMKLALLEGGK